VVLGIAPGGSALLDQRRCGAQQAMRATMMPLSVDDQFSLVRSQIGPMLSCKRRILARKPATPLKVCGLLAARSIRYRVLVGDWRNVPARICQCTRLILHGVDLALCEGAGGMEI